MQEAASVQSASANQSMCEAVEEADANLLVVIKEMREAAKAADESNDPGTVDLTLVQIRILFCEVKKAEHLLACGWALEKPIATRRRLSLDSSQQYLLTNSAVDSSFGI
jgi:hypothetical protein